MKAWKLIRCAFSEKVRKLPTGSGAEDRVDYIYADELQFVMPYLEDRSERTSSLAVADSQKDPFLPIQPTNNESSGSTHNGNDSDSDETSERDRASAKRRIDDAFHELVEIVKAPEEDNGEAGLFGKSVAHFLRRLQPHIVRPAKMSIEGLMYDIESGRSMRLTSFVPVEVVGGAEGGRESLDDSEGSGSGGMRGPDGVGEDVTID
ncbi:hypothetical protein AAVH_14366 [Aphelenchoides avenae]|nr:hypothetical protein AAVH_14366 [Aphelenchus avenae]